MIFAFHEHVDFAQGRDRKTVVLFFHFEAFESDEIARFRLTRSIDDAERSLLDSIENFELVDASAALNSGIIDGQLFLLSPLLRLLRFLLLL